MKRRGKKKKGKSRQDHIRLRNLPEMCPLFIFIIMAIRINARSTQRLVDVPLGTIGTALAHGGQLTEEVTRQIDRAVVATHALVDHNTSGGLALVRDGDGLAAVTVGHDTVGQGENVLDGTIVGGATGAGVGAGGGSVVEGDLTVARGALGADAGAGADSGLGVGGTGGSRGSGRGLSLHDGSGSGRGLGLHGGSGSSSGGGGGSGRRSLLHLLGRSLNSRDRGSGSGGGRGSGGRSLLYLLGRGLNNGGSSGGRDGVGDDRDDSRSLSGLRVDGGGDIDGGPDDISDGLPNDGAFGNGSRVASQGEESASKGESLGDRSHCE